MGNFWKKFDDLLDSVPDYIEEETRSIQKQVSSGSSISTVIQNGKKIVVKTVNGKTTVTVNGKEYVEKK